MSALIGGTGVVSHYGFNGKNNSEHVNPVCKNHETHHYCRCRPRDQNRSNNTSD